MQLISPSFGRKNTHTHTLTHIQTHTLTNTHTLTHTHTSWDREQDTMCYGTICYHFLPLLFPFLAKYVFYSWLIFDFLTLLILKKSMQNFLKNGWKKFWFMINYKLDNVSFNGMKSISWNFWRIGTISHEFIEITYRVFEHKLLQFFMIKWCMFANPWISEVSSIGWGILFYQDFA